jgi:hypothetical protein
MTKRVKIELTEFEAKAVYPIIDHVDGTCGDNQFHLACQRVAKKIMITGILD